MNGTGKHLKRRCLKRVWLVPRTDKKQGAMILVHVTVARSTKIAVSELDPFALNSRPRTDPSEILGFKFFFKERDCSFPCKLRSLLVVPGSICVVIKPV